jgi:hypothetical protein
MSSQTGGGRESSVEPEWAQISSISVGLNDHRLPSSKALAGRTVILSAANEKSISIEFTSESRLRWQQGGEQTEEVYDAVESATSLFVVGVCHQRDSRLSTTLVLDLECGRATRVVGRLPLIEEADQSLLARVHADAGLSPVHVDFEQWEIQSAGSSQRRSGPVHARTDELVGKRIRYEYGDGGVYEHIYLNDRMFTWHCLRGPETGLADTERCDFFRIRPEVYLFSWREKIIPTLGVVVVNKKQMHSNGIITGSDTRSGEVSHFPVGARGTLVNVTERF